MVDLGDIEVGDHIIDPVQIFNIDPNRRQMGLGARYTGDPSVTIRKVPDQLHPTAYGVDMNDNATELYFAPTHEGRITGTLSVSVGGAPESSSVLVPVRGAAHLPGAPTLQAQDAERVEMEDAAKVSRDRSDRTTRLRDDADRRDHEHHRHPDSFTDDKVRLDAAKDDAQIELAALFELRKNGVDAAEKEASSFQREVPAHESSLAFELGMFALNFATEGIAGVVGKRLEGMLESGLATKIAKPMQPGAALDYTVEKASKSVVAFFSNGVKDEVKTAGKADVAKLGAHHDTKTTPGTPAPSAPSEQPVSTNPVIAFFGSETRALIMQNADLARRTVGDAYGALIPLLDHQAEMAVTAMRLCATGLKAEATRAQTIQAEASSSNWVRYLAQQSLGDIAAEDQPGKLHGDRDGLALTNMAAANNAQNEDGELTRFDGLVDIGFEADLDKPDEPVTVKEAKIKGVSKDAALRIGSKPLLQQRLPVRAYGMPSRNAASVPVAVVRDEAGNIKLTDESGGFGRGGYLARKAGHAFPTPSAERDGARKLIEQEIMAVALGKIIGSDSVK